MKLSKVGVLCSMFFASCLSSFSQSVNPQTQMPNVFPVNPKAFEFVKYAEVPVGKYTGVPSISIPIFNIQAAGLEMPVTVSYHSNGFRVSEEAGWTGLGWTLNAGGSVVQVVNGLDDFGWYRNRDNELQSMVNICNVPSTAFDNAAAVDFLLTNQPPKIGFGEYSLTHPFQWNNQLIDGLKDIKPDVFKLNVLGYSEEFVLDWATETFKCITDNNIKVEAPNYTNNPSNGETPPLSFKIKTPDGNQFLFTLKEESKTSGVAHYSSTPFPYSEHLIGSKSSRVYQLTSIYSKGGDLISFNYLQTQELENLPSVSHSFTFQSGAQGANPIPFTNNPQGTTINYSRQSLSYLSSIDFPNGRLLFNSTNDRIDFIGMRKLNSIELKDLNNLTIKSFDFSYGYFIGHSLGNNCDQYLDAQSPVYHTGKVASELTHRLKLLSIEESGQPPYSFEYEQELLPKKTSFAVDNWGFYNGKHNNVDFMPNIYMMGMIDPNLIGIKNNKNSTLASSKAAVLKKLTYPTGGSSSFEYELNTIENFRIPDDQHSNVNAVFLNDRNNSGDNPAQIFTADVPSILYAGTFNISTYGPMSSSTNGLSAYIRMTVLKKTVANIALTNSPTTFWPMYYTTPLGQLHTQVSDVLQDTRILQFEFNTSTQQYEIFKLLENQAIALDPANIYIIQAYLDNSFGPQTNGSQGAGASVHFTFLKNSSHSVSYGAGLRIKTIKTANPLEIPLIKSYEYSGGKLMSPLFYLSNSKVNFQIFSPVSTMVPIFKTEIGSSSFLAPSTNASGKYVGYDIVSEMNSTLDPNTQNIVSPNGKVTDHYTNNSDRGSLNSLFNYFPFADPSTYDGTWPYIPYFEPREYLNFVAPLQKHKLQNGLPKISRIYDASQTLIEETINEWDYVTAPNHTYSRVSTLNLRSQPIPVSGGINYNYCVGFYPLVSTKTLLTSSTKKVYSGVDVISSRQNNFYDSYNQLAYSTITDSRQNTIKTDYKYPYNFPEYSSMANNTITPVIEKTAELISGSGTKSIARIKNTYTGFTSLSGAGIWEVTSVWGSKGSGILEEEIVYELFGNYNTPEKHKLLQYRDRSGVVTSIFWGYNGQYPVAKIVNMTYAQALAQSGVSLNVIGNPAITDVALRTELNKFRQLGNCLVTTYTYKPLVGVTSETDANGRTSFFEYDAIGRLTLVRDIDNKIIKKICYNYAGQIENCTTNASWQLTGSTRCKPCSSNGSYSTNTLQNEQRDLNPSSTTYNQTQWVDAGTSSSCGLAAWQNEGSVYCELNSSSQNTGNQVQLQRDLNPCSPTYNQTRIIQIAYNTTACPLPASCTFSNCNAQGPDKRCVGGVCETGVKVYTASNYNSSTGLYECTYHYEWSNSWSHDYVEYNIGDCPIW